MSPRVARVMAQSAALYTGALFLVALIAGQWGWMATGAGLFLVAAQLCETMHSEEG